MLLAAEFGSGQALWSIFWLFIFVMWIFLIIFIFSDIIRSHDLSGWGKALWAGGIIFFPYIGIFAYLIIRGGSMSERQLSDAKEADAAMQTYIRETTGGTTDADQLSKLSDLHTAGKLDDAEYASAKAKVIGS
ncbi:MAG: SHOCT domain-containing protein [Actinobacteria bacterium]|nr:MAG: SHOCT domain-containing protein [Actinomycetota bacterium]